MSLADISLGPHAAEYVYLNSVTNFPPLAILYYDYLLTLPWEIQFLWSSPGKKRWVTMACLFNRYLPVFGHIPLAVSYFMPPGDLPGIHLYHVILGMFMQSLAGLLLLIRVYALYEQSRRVLGILVSSITVSILVACWAMIGSHRAGVDTIQVISSVSGCNQYLPSKGGRYGALAWSSMLVFDSVIFSLTLYKAFTMGKGMRLLDVIVRDGAMYYSALFIMNLSNILVLLFAPPLLKNSTSSITSVLSITLVSRLMLNLHAQNAAQAGLSMSIESERGFQAALPLAPAPMTDPGSPVAA